MRSDIKTYTYPNGEIQRVQLVQLDDWTSLEFLRPASAPSTHALDCFADIYRQYLIPACPWIFGHMVMFQLPESLDSIRDLFDSAGERIARHYGKLAEPLTIAAAMLQQGMQIHGNKPHFADQETMELWHALEEHNCIRIVSGKLPTTQVIPVGHNTGYLSGSTPDAALKVNASFFIMDMFDCATVYDHVGTPFGLCVKNGVVESPPLFQREALLVHEDGSVRIEIPDLRDMDIEIAGQVYRHGKNATIYSRPEYARTPRSSDLKLVIVGNRVVAVSTAASVAVPASGVVLCTKDTAATLAGATVTYHGMEDIQFGIQVGNSIIRGGVKTEHFLSPFFDIYGILHKPWHTLCHREARTPYPPSLYPMNFDQGRAARIALGADAEGKPMLLWAEGAGKLGYQAGIDSRGASLRDMAEICTELGMKHAINLDGGGSAQILLQGQRGLRISDRNREDNSDAERLVPLGLITHQIE